MEESVELQKEELRELVVREAGAEEEIFSSSTTRRRVLALLPLTEERGLLPAHRVRSSRSKTKGEV